MRWFILIVILYMATNGKTAGITAKSPFCQFEDEENRGKQMPCPRDVGLNCVAKLTAPEQECSNLNFSTSLFGGQVSLHQDESLFLTDVIIRPYTFQRSKKPVPNFNVSFSDIKFTSLIYRVKVACDLDHVMRCWKVDLSDANQTVHKSSNLFWDCYWFNSSFRLCTFTLEYQALKGNQAELKKFTFKLPQKSDIKSTNPEILVSIQHTVECVLIHWASSHESISNFRVKLHEFNNTDNVPVIDIIVNGTKHKFCSELKPYTLYNVSVEGNISHNVWSQPYFSVPFSTISAPSGYSLGILIPIFFLCIIIMIFLSASLLKYYLSKNTTKPKKCVIVYNPSTLKHAVVVTALVKFLRCFMPVCYFESDYYKNNNETAAGWWSKVLSDADLILVVSNPTPSDMECPGSIHYPYFATGHLERCLEQCIDRKRRAIRILLPYCQKNNFYEFLKACTPCYHILRDRFKLLQEILGPQNIYLPHYVASHHYSIYFHTEYWRRLEELLTSETALNCELQSQELRNSVHQSMESLPSDTSTDVDDDVEDNQIYLKEIQNYDSSEAENE